VNDWQTLYVYPGEHHMGRLQVAEKGTIHLLNGDTSQLTKIIIQQSSDIWGSMSAEQTDTNNVFIVGLPYKDFRPGERPRSKTGSTAYGQGNYLNFWNGGDVIGTLLAEGVRLQNANF